MMNITETIKNKFTFLMAAFLIYSAIGINWTNVDEGLIYSHYTKLSLGFCLYLISSNLKKSFIIWSTDKIFFISLILLILVPICGTTSMGAQRWINLGFTFQPSEIFKIVLPLSLALFIHQRGLLDDTKNLMMALSLTLLPVILILNQPDLGTAIIITSGAAACIIASGITFRTFTISTGILLSSLPLTWMYLLHDYQKDRILSLLNFNSDRLGSDYHVIQSKIAIGNGGGFGRTDDSATQTALGYVPELHTDFIAAAIAEHTGFMGITLLIMLYLILIFFSYTEVIKSNSLFDIIYICGLITTIILSAVVNLAMISGYLPVVGLPLPLLSYGGTSIFIFCIGIGLISNKTQ
ncbi:FtsW/RodA/SpoVE family cell cycle protein [Photobacterium leiognathi]|uniref:FtsW/RodA/SpoVE family cell cycle protein n=1 Tax=Photobacterium leiognathi TaxID=553611 RepID=UPI0029822F70|nr:FtsW/RodA/SpoVE family cell cycle protein [Photobacterium leiognathi]